ncbi:CENPX protein, partial [Alcedo cyanopectus]|nr:CENPX protein [Ceyx cyanopectus]
ARSPLSSPQETVERLLRLHFRDRRTRVSGDAQLLMAEMLNVFVRGEHTAFSRRRAPGPPEPRWGPGALAAAPTLLLPAETAARAARQAQAEDVEKVNIEHVEKVLPQLVGGC